MSAIASSAPSSLAAAPSTPTTLPTPAADFLLSEIHKVSNFLTGSNSLLVAGGAILSSAGLGALAAGLFTTLSPLAGALYAVTSATVGTMTDYTVDLICTKWGGAPNHSVKKTARAALPIITGIGAGCTALILAGCTLTPGTVVGLTLGSMGLLLTVATTGVCGLVGVSLGVAAYNIYQGKYRHLAPATSQGHPAGQ
jgi:hypothetical protein